MIGKEKSIVASVISLVKMISIKVAGSIHSYIMELLHFDNFKVENSLSYSNQIFEVGL